MDLNSLRAEIDAIDARLVPLIVQRMRVSARIADVKRKEGLPVRDAAREAAVLNGAAALAGAPEDAGDVRLVYAALLDASRQRQLCRARDGALPLDETDGPQET